MRDYLLIYLNGERLELRGNEVFMTLSNYLRSRQMTGTKVVCEEGDCGACTVLRGKAYTQINSKEKLTYQSINSCITFMYLMDCSHILTIEAAHKIQGGEQIQNAIIDQHGTQCGFCTPGIVMSLIDMAEKKNSIKEKNIKNYLSGNLCRCTGYDAIVKAGISIDTSSVPLLNTQFDHGNMLNCIEEHKKIPVKISYLNQFFYSPTEIKEVLTIKKETNGLIKSSATDLGVQINKSFSAPDTKISLSLLPSLYELSHKDGVLTIGAKVSLTEIQGYVKTLIPEFHRLLNIFASPQIKNSATLIGNIANASPIGDTIPFMMIANSIIVVEGICGTREVNINNFYKGYKTLDLKNDEIITKILCPIPKKDEIIKLYKVSKRKDLDISCVTAGFRMKLEQSKIKSLQFALGGVGPTVIRLDDFEKKFSNQHYSMEIFEKLGTDISNFIQPMSDVRGSEKYRRLLVKNLFKKFYIDSSSQGSHHD